LIQSFSLSPTILLNSRFSSSFLLSSFAWIPSTPPPFSPQLLLVGLGGLVLLGATGSTPLAVDTWRASATALRDIEVVGLWEGGREGREGREGGRISEIGHVDVGRLGCRCHSS